MRRSHPSPRVAALALAVILLVTVAGLAIERSADRPARFIHPGTSGSFEFSAGDAGVRGPIRVWYAAPATGIAGAPVLVVMTGRQRNAEEYRDQWQPLVERYGFLVVVPELSDALFPGHEYNVATIADGSDGDEADAGSAFAVVEPLYDAVKADVRSTSTSYYLYGHSAGAQFVHRFLIFHQPNRVAKAVAANAGWYTTVDTETAYPYGLAGSPATLASIERALRTPLVLLLGEDDNDPTTDGLRTTSGANRQGPHRLARGKYFFASGRAAAEELGVAFNWSALIVPDAGHDNGTMAPAAAALLFG